MRLCELVTVIPMCLKEVHYRIKRKYLDSVAL